MEDKTAKVGMLLFLATEVMFFAGLISAYWVLRVQVTPWPPLGQPRLPIVITGVNTLILLASGVAMFRSEQVLRRGCQPCFVGWLGLAGLGGLVFLGIQGYEWLRLLHFGLTTVKNIYGGTFYFLVGAHALHLIVALVVLLVVFFHAVQGRYSETRHTGVTLCRFYWSFVIIVWPVLYVLVYLL